MNSVPAVSEVEPACVPTGPASLLTIFAIALLLRAIAVSNLNIMTHTWASSRPVQRFLKLYNSTIINKCRFYLHVNDRYGWYDSTPQWLIDPDASLWLSIAWINFWVSRFCFAQTLPQMICAIWLKSGFLREPGGKNGAIYRLGW